MSAAHGTANLAENRILQHAWTPAMISARAIARHPLSSVDSSQSGGRVIVIDQDPSVRRSLEQLITTEGWELETLAAAEEFLGRPRGNRPCVLIVELTLPGLSGLELQQQLDGRPDLPIIFLTARMDVRMTVQAMKAGALEFLIKPIHEAALLAALRTAIDRSRTALCDASEMDTLMKGYSSLTPRERQVMKLVVCGLLNKQVAGELGISEITVKAHRGQVMRKMKAESLPHLVTIAARLEWHTRPSQRAEICA